MSVLFPEAVLSGRSAGGSGVERKAYGAFCDGVPTAARTGIVMERGVAHRDGRMHGTVHTWLTRRSANRETEVLLQKRSAEKESHPGCWDISSAGHLQAGDTFEEAAVRELEEELGISVGKDSLEFVGWNHDRLEDSSMAERFWMMRSRKRMPIPIRGAGTDEAPEGGSGNSSVDALAECLKKMKDSSWKNCLRNQEMEMLREYLEKETE